jgi:dimeric dUTPase (all-alpha-NTP-PPase superfamily)
MNLANEWTMDDVFQAQKAIDEEIYRNNGLNQKDLLPKKWLALHTELGEFAQEIQGEWKYWKKHAETNRKRALAEAVDCMHFFVSIAIDKGWEKALEGMWIEALEESKENGLDGGIVGALNETISLVTLASFKEDGMMPEPLEQYSKREYQFRNAWYVFNLVLIVGLGFDDDEIFNAYFAKNKQNFKRQEDDY